GLLSLSCNSAGRRAHVSCRMSGSDWRNPGAGSRRRAAPSSFLVRSDPMSQRKVAVVGAGMTKFMRRALESPKELAWLAAKSALESAEMKLDQIDCVVLGSAPDAFDGLHMKGEYLSDGCGGWKKPYLRCYIGGGTASTPWRKPGFTSPPGCSIPRWWYARRKCQAAFPILRLLFLRSLTTSRSNLSSRICSGSLPSNRPVICKRTGLQSKKSPVFRSKTNAMPWATQRLSSARISPSNKYWRPQSWPGLCTD